jgi:hypothetical protein
MRSSGSDTDDKCNDGVTSMSQAGQSYKCQMLAGLDEEGLKTKIFESCLLDSGRVKAMEEVMFDLLPMQLHSWDEHLRKVIYCGIITRGCS